MATLILIRLDCKSQEDWTFDDSIRIEVNGQAAWSGSMDEGQQKSLGNKAVLFQDSAKIQLFEEDWPDGDDDLGTYTVDEQGTVAAARSARFTGDGADYTLWYSVYGDNTPKDLPPPDPAKPADPAEPGKEPPPTGPGDIGDPTSPCALGHPIIEVKDGIDNTPIQGASVRIALRGIQGVTGPDGRFDGGLVLPGQVVAEASKDNYFPFPAARQVVIQDCRGGDTLIPMTLSKEQVVAVTPADTKWYINLDADESKLQGRPVTIKARVSTKTPGLRIYWTLDKDANNRAGLEADKQAKLEPAFSQTDANGEATTKLTLSTYGGDRFRVSASLAPNTAPGTPGAKESGWITVWRKIFYDIIQMKKPSGGQWEMPAGTMPQVATAFGKVFVEMISAGAVINTNDSVDNFDTAGDGYDWADGHTDSRSVPWKVNYVVVGYACGKEEKEVEQTVNTMTANVGPTFRPYDFKGVNPIAKAQYKPTSGGSWTDFPAGKVTLTGSNPSKQLKVDFNGTGVDPTRAAQKVKIKYVEANSANGWGGSSLHLLICRGTFDEFYNTAGLSTVVAGTSIHEPGHSLGLVMGLPWETADAAHDSHCTHRTCVMWWQGYVGRPHDFHPPATSDPGCHTFMRGFDMSRTNMNTKWKFPR